MENNKTIEDVMICPLCKSENCYEYSRDEVEFAFDNSHCIVDCHCSDCNNDFRLSFNFEYNITKHSIY